MSASKMLCFTRYFGLIIGDLVLRDSEYWSMYILLKQIIDIIATKSLQPEASILLNTLISNITICMPNF